MGQQITSKILMVFYFPADNTICLVAVNRRNLPIRVNRIFHLTPIPITPERNMPFNPTSNQQFEDNYGDHMQPEQERSLDIQCNSQHESSCNVER